MKGLVWIRRDLRLHDHAALSMATKECDEVALVFCFDKKILSKLKDKEDRRLTFIYESLSEIEEKVGLHVVYGDPIEEIPKLFKKLKADRLFYNRDYEPYAIKRDKVVKEAVSDVQSFKDSVFFEPHEVLKNDGGPYTVFTPYKNKWLEEFSSIGRNVSQFKVQLKKIDKGNGQLSKVFKKTGFSLTENILIGGSKQGKKLLNQFRKKISGYDEARDFPAQEGTSNLSVYIRHGCISVREMISLALETKDKGHQVWLSEIIWREFYQMIICQFPHAAKKEFRQKYEGIDWQGGQKEFKAWSQGQTGFPVVDAAMRCLNETGMMPNRLRMVTASFLCKTLLVNWQKGEKYFAEKLLDFDLAANNGGWQWSASSGCDAQPYFRIFNPYSQSEKFDKEGIFIRKWCPELSGFTNKRIHDPSQADMLEQSEAECQVGKDYPHPVVDYSRKRQEALKMYKKALG